MTPFEAAGYTKDSKFKVILPYNEFKVGDTVVLSKDDGTDNPAFSLESDSSVWEFMFLPNAEGCTKELELIVEQEVSSNVYPNPPHKHAAIIKQWADGAEIEYRVSGSEWYSAKSPNWSWHREYRVKPQKSDKDIQIEKLEAEFKKASSDTASSWESCIAQTNLLINIATKLQELKSNV